MKILRGKSTKTQHVLPYVNKRTIDLSASVTVQHPPLSLILQKHTGHIDKNKHRTLQIRSSFSAFISFGPVKCHTNGLVGWFDFLCMVMRRRSFYISTLFPGQAWAVNQYLVHIHSIVTEKKLLRKMALEIISLSISTKLWDRARIKFSTLYLQPDT